MATEELRITCTSKNNTGAFGPVITHVGGGISLFAMWKYTKEEAIRMIDTFQCTFYVMVGNKRVNVIVVREGALDHPYLKTVDDGYLPNNLLNLPDCAT